MKRILGYPDSKISEPLPVGIEAKFKHLVERWEAATEKLSAVVLKTDHHTYHEIAGLGEDAVPFLLAKLESEPALWLNALRQAARIDPVHPKHKGNPENMAADWFGWARSRGIGWGGRAKRKKAGVSKPVIRGHIAIDTNEEETEVLLHATDTGRRRTTLSLTPEQAREWAQKLVEAADSCQGGTR